MIKRNLLKVFYGFLFIFLMPQITFAEDVSTEMALFEEIPMVITPSKKPQPIKEAPASVYVITQEDIKQSGSINLWDVLRQVPGMDVSTSTIGQADVSMRGFGDLITNKTLLLVDGRSVYLPAQGLLLWEMIPVQLEEIERIEVVKGPVASLYGANANLGLINIITKKPQQMDGGTVSVTGGSRDTERYSVMYGGVKDDFSYKLSTGWKTQNSFNNERSRDALDMVQGNSMVEYKIDDDSTIALSGGIAQGDNYFYTSNGGNPPDFFYFGPAHHTMTYVKSDYTRGNFSSRFFWNYYKTHYETLKLSSDAEINSFDGELRYNLELNEKNSMIIGGGGHFDHAWSNIFAGSDNRDHRQGIWDIFVQDDHKLSDQWKLNGSLRLDHYEITGDNISARLAAIYYPNENDTFRFSVGNSFRNPTLSENYLDLTILISGFPVVTRGNKGLSSEKYLTYEISYQGEKMDGRFRPFADLFFTQIEEIIDSYTTGGGPIGQDSSFWNQGDAISSGGELGGEYDVDKHLTLITNYALNHVYYNDSEKYWSPKHKVNGGIKYKSLDAKLSARLLAHYVSGAHTTTATDGKVPSYVQGTLWVGYKLKDDVEVSVAGYNIFHDKHQESLGGDDIGSRILGNLTVKF